MAGWPAESYRGIRGNPELTARYEVVKRIGEGSFGDVFQGRRRTDGLVVALKEIHHPQSSRRELHALLRLHHQNIVKLLEYFKHGPNVVLVLEYAPANLADVIAAGPLGEAAIKGILAQILQGLAACHATSMVHRDLKPSNILLTADGLFKLADFGTARIVKESSLDGGARNVEEGIAASGTAGSDSDVGTRSSRLKSEAVDVDGGVRARQSRADDAQIGRESPVSRGDVVHDSPGALVVQKSDYFVQQEGDGGEAFCKSHQSCQAQSLPVQDASKCTDVKGLAGGQKHSDFFKKLKGFLKKGSQHSQKHEKVSGREGPRTDSWLFNAQEEDLNEYRQPSGRWISPVNSQLCVFDNKENQDQGVAVQHHSSSSLACEADCLSEKMQSTERHVSSQCEKGTLSCHHISHVRDEDADVKSSVPSHSEGVVGKGSRARSDTEPRVETLVEEQVKTNQVHPSTRTELSVDTMEDKHEQLQCFPVEDLLQKLNCSVHMQMNDEGCLVEEVKYDQIQVQGWNVDESREGLIHRLGSEDSFCDKIMPTVALCSSYSKEIVSEEEMVAHLPESAGESTKSQLTALTKPSEEREMKKLVLSVVGNEEQKSIHQDEPEPRLDQVPKTIDFAEEIPDRVNYCKTYAVNGNDHQITGTRLVRSTDKTLPFKICQGSPHQEETAFVHGSKSLVHLPGFVDDRPQILMSEESKQPSDVREAGSGETVLLHEDSPEKQTLVSSTQSGTGFYSRCFASFSPGTQVLGFHPKHGVHTAASSLYDKADSVPEHGFRNADELRNIIQPSFTVHNSGLQLHKPLRSSLQKMALGIVDSEPATQFNGGPVGNEGRQTLEEGGMSSSIDNWDRSIHEARRNLEQGGGVYGLYQNRGGWHGFNSELKCWGVITSKGKVLGQSLSHGGANSRLPRMTRSGLENPRLALEKPGQKVSFSEGGNFVKESDLQGKKYPERKCQMANTFPSQLNVLDSNSPKNGAEKSDCEITGSTSSFHQAMIIPPRKGLKSFLTAGESIYMQKNNLEFQGSSGWISPSDRFNILTSAVSSNENETPSSTELYQPGQQMLELEGNNGSEWSSPSERFDFTQVRSLVHQSESKSSLSDLSNIDGSDTSLQQMMEPGLKHWSDIEKESESGQEGWDKASGEWSIDKDAFGGEVEGAHGGSLGRSEETRWFGPPEVKDSYLMLDNGGFNKRGPPPGEKPQGLFLEDTKYSEPEFSAVSDNKLDLSYREQDWDDADREEGFEISEGPSGLSSETSVSRSGSQDDETESGIDFTGGVGSRWYKSPEILYGATKYGQAVDLWSVGLIFAELLKGEPLLPGINDIDQLSRIVRLLGSPSERNWPGVSKLPDFDKIFFGDNCPPLSLVEEFPAASQASLKLLKRFLVYNPALRLSAEEALKDEFFLVDPLPASPHELKLPIHRRKDSNSEEWGEWREQESSSLSDFELLS